MTSCCHCGRPLCYKRSVDQECGSWCRSHKGKCGFSYYHPDTDVEFKSERPEEFKKELVKGLTRGAIIGAALGVTCVLTHVACIVTAFINNHYYLKTAASSVYSAVKNRNEQDKHPAKEAMISGVMETSNIAGLNALTSRLGKAFAEFAHARSGVSLSWAGEIGKETGKSMIEQGSNAVFDWSSKAVI